MPMNTNDNSTPGPNRGAGRTKRQYNQYPFRLPGQQTAMQGGKIVIIGGAEGTPRVARTTLENKIRDLRGR